MTTKHTPGPWKSVAEALPKPYEDVIVKVPDGHGGFDRRVARLNHANCWELASYKASTNRHQYMAHPTEWMPLNHVIVDAAPELLEALQATYEALGISYPLHSCDMDKRGYVLDKARAAIAKATAEAA